MALERFKYNRGVTTILPVNAFIGIIFIIFNPIYALLLSTLLSLYTRKQISNVLVGVLFTFSFSLLYFSQDYNICINNIKCGEKTDIENYVSLYTNIGGPKKYIYTYQYLLDRFVNDFLHNEFLWFAYNKFISDITDNNIPIFIFITYFVIFGLSAYLAYLISIYHNGNYLYYLFCLIFINMGFQYSAYYQWRHIIASLLFLIGLVKYNSLPTNYVSRILMYISALFHIVTVPLILSFELYNIFNKKAYKQRLNLRYYLGIMLLIIIGCITYAWKEDIMQFIYQIPGLSRAFSKNNELLYSPQFIITPITILFMYYFIIYYKKLLYFELYMLLLFLLLMLMPLILHIPINLYGRMIGTIVILLSLIASKVIVQSGHIGVLVVLSIFIYRMYTLFDPRILGDMANIGYGNYINPFYGPFIILAFYKSPIIML